MSRPRRLGFHGPRERNWPPGGGLFLIDGCAVGQSTIETVLREER